MDESTRVMPVGGAPDDRTMVAGAPMQAAPAAGATQMGVTIPCPVCKTMNSGMEKYCGECGFLLASAPGETAEAPAEASGGGIELVEASSGRTFALKQGVNVVGRENCDILLMDGTVSRRHAQVTLENGALSVTDLGSTNGTQVNGAPIAAQTPTPINPGDTVKFGSAMLTLPGAAAEATIVTPAQTAAPAEPTLMAGPVETLEPASQEISVPEVDFVIEEPSVPAPADTEAVVEEPVARLAPANPTTAEVTLKAGTIAVGRRATNDIVISNDPYISGNHAQFMCDEIGCYITDVGSTNGTTVNGQRLEPKQAQLLMNGDEIGLGQQAYRYEALAKPLADAVAPHAVLLNEGEEA